MIPPPNPCDETAQNDDEPPIKASYCTYCGRDTRPHGVPWADQTDIFQTASFALSHAFYVPIRWQG